MYYRKTDASRTSSTPHPAQLSSSTLTAPVTGRACVVGARTMARVARRLVEPFGVHCCDRVNRHTRLGKSVPSDLIERERDPTPMLIPATKKPTGMSEPAGRSVTGGFDARSGVG